MPVKPETNLIRSIHKHVLSYYMKNNNPYLGGIPDCFYSGMEDDLWIEYKYIAISKPNKPVIPDLSALQLDWIENRKIEGREIWVVVGYKKGIVVFKNMKEIEFGISPDLFVQRTQTRKELANEINTYCGPSRRIYDQQHKL